MKLNNALTLYGVISKNEMSDAQYLKKIEDSIKGGVTIIQIREKTGSFEEKVRLAQQAKKVTDKYDIPLIVNDDIDICKQINADGVHLGQTDGSVREARQRLGSKKIIGVSADTVALAKKAANEGADYLGTGAIFPTSTKLDAQQVAISTLQAICNAASLPVVAIGGIDQTNVLKLKGTGIAGIAVVSALYNDDHSYDNAMAMKKLAARIAVIRNKLIICDVDGVLLDSVGVWKGVGGEYLESKGLMPKPHFEQILGTCSFEQGLAMIKNDYGVQDSVGQIMKEITKLVQQRYIKDIHPQVMAKPFLQAASKHNCLYLCSDTNSQALTPALKKHGLLDYADGLVTSDIAKCSKTSKGIYQYCNDRSGYAIKDTIVFEDFLYPIQTAKDAGYYVIGVQEKHSLNNMDEIKTVADEYLESLAQMEERL